MGYAMMIGKCWGCGRMFGFNPHKVPSMRDHKGVRQPVCKNCVDAANVEKAKRGLPLFEYPDNAYQPCDENEL